MKSIIFIAPPAAGKGTQSVLIKDKYGIPHISTGDLLRNEALVDEHIKSELALGHFIADDITLNLLKKRLQKEDCNNGYILDGFPRNLNQALAYEKILGELNKQLGVIIVLDLDRAIALKRIVGRLSCTTCGAIYNDMLSDMMPKQIGICDKCGSKLSKRSDDNETTFNTRYETYQTQTAPLIDYYQGKHLLYHVNSGISKEYTFAAIEKIING